MKGVGDGNPGTVYLLKYYVRNSGDSVPIKKSRSIIKYTVPGIAWSFPWLIVVLKLQTCYVGVNIFCGCP
jgi:hypothetical protein